MTRTPILLLTLAVLLPAHPARACTTVCLSRGRQVLVAKSFDFHVGHGLAVVNKRGVSKQALEITPKTRPARWISRYGSVTFNQYGREMPLGGMNERGLVVEIMWLNSTRQPTPKPDRETVNELQLIQYLLDRCATVQEAVAAVRKLQVTRVYAKVHYMVCDRRGACATVEYLDGRAVLHQGKRLPYRVLTNHPYAVALRDLRGRRGFGGKRAISGGRGSLERFARAAVHERAFRRSKKDGIALAFAALEDVQQGDYTQWQIVYEPGAGRVHFRGGDEEQHTTVELGKQDFTCGTPVQVMDILGTLRPGKRALVPYSLQLNRRLVQKSFKALKVPFPAPVLEMLARYPETTRCGNAAPQTGSR